MRRETGLLRFVRALLNAESAERRGDLYRIGGGPAAPAGQVLDLISRGALDGDDATCRRNGETLAWLKRARLDEDAFAAQHRDETAGENGVRINLAESPLARLATGTGGAPPFLQPHHVEAGERVRRLVERAHLQPRLTMSYSGVRTDGGRQSAAGDLSDLAAEARRTLDTIQRTLPVDCAGVVIDVCGYLKGLQVVESERGWPRRSAKLVLRIGLDQLAAHFGLDPVAVGRSTGRGSGWIGSGSRPSRFE